MPNGEPGLSLALECLDRAGFVNLRVIGASMMPRIPPGSYVCIRRAAAETLALNDIVLVRTATGVRLHRLIAVEDAGYITRGDANDKADPPVQPVSVLGVLTSVEAPRWRDRVEQFWSRFALKAA